MVDRVYLGARNDHSGPDRPAEKGVVVEGRQTVQVRRAGCDREGVVFSRRAVVDPRGLPAREERVVRRFGHGIGGLHELEPVAVGILEPDVHRAVGIDLGHVVFRGGVVGLEDGRGTDDDAIAGPGALIIGVGEGADGGRLIIQRRRRVTHFVFVFSHGAAQNQ